MPITASDTRSFLHLGTTKTGSSFLQQKVFSRAKRVQYFHNEAPRLTEAMRANAKVADLGKPLEANKKKILSHEVLHGRPADRMAPLLYHTFGPSSVLVVTRSPVEWVQSFYFQRIRNGEELAPQDWLEENIEGLSRQLNFDVLQQGYAKVFGSENIHFLPYEMLRAEPLVFLEHLKRIAGLDFDASALEMSFVNRSASVQQMDTMRRANEFLNRLGKRNKDLQKQMTEFRHSVVKQLTQNAAEDRANDPGLFSATDLAPLYGGMACLDASPAYTGYHPHYCIQQTT